MDTIIAWSGWIVAVGMAIWKIVETRRNRPNIRVTIPIATDQVITIAADNEGRKPINLVWAGFRFANGFEFGYPSDGQIFPLWLFSKKGIAVDFDIKIIKDILKKDNTVIEFICFTDETGRKFKGEIPEEWRKTIYEIN